MIIYLRYLYIFMLFITYGNGYLITMNDNYNSINKLNIVKNNINNYIEKNKYVNNNKNEIKKTMYNNPIKSVNYEKILINISIIKKIYLSYDYDRVIIDTGYNKYVYYIKTDDDKLKFNILISVLPNECKKIIVCDKSIMTDNFGSLYCE